MLEAGEDTLIPTYTDTPVSVPFDVYRAMLAAAPLDCLVSLALTTENEP